MNFVILTGASGAGKTAIANVIAITLGHSVTCLHFDSAGEPRDEPQASNLLY
jgi:uridine kinase